MPGGFAHRSPRATPVILLALLTGCAAPPTQPALTVLNVSVSSAASPWIDGLYPCTPAGAAVRLSDSSSSDLELRLGEPDHLGSPAYQIDSAEMLVVVHPQTGVGQLTLDQVRELFSGQVTNWSAMGGADVAVQVWTYAPAEDVEEYFDRAILNGRPVTSLARLAVSAQSMSDSVGLVAGSIGFLPRRWKTGNTREVLALPSLPVLAITKTEPAGMLKDLLSCLQSSTNGTP